MMEITILRRKRAKLRRQLRNLKSKYEMAKEEYLSCNREVMKVTYDIKKRSHRFSENDFILLRISGLAARIISLEGMHKRYKIQLAGSLRCELIDEKDILRKIEVDNNVNDKK